MPRGPAAKRLEKYLMHTYAAIDLGVCDSVTGTLDGFRDEVLREAAETIRKSDVTAISDDAREIFDRAADLIDPDKDANDTDPA